MSKHRQRKPTSNLVKQEKEDEHPHIRVYNAQSTAHLPKVPVRLNTDEDELVREMEIEDAIHAKLMKMPAFRDVRKLRPRNPRRIHE